MGPRLREARGALQAFRNNYRTPRADIDAELAKLQQTLQGIFDAARTRPLAPPPRPPGRSPPARGAILQVVQAPRWPWSVSTHDSDRGPADSEAPAARRTSPASAREAIWGFVFIGPWLIGLVLFTAGPMIASLVMSFTDFDLRPARRRRRSSGSTTTSGWPTDPLVAQRSSSTLKFALIVIPVTMFASLGFALLLNHPQAAGSRARCARSSTCRS